MSILNDELNKVKDAFGLINKTKCSGDEQKIFRGYKKEKYKLPDDVMVSEKDGAFYRIKEVEIDITMEEFTLILLHRQLEYMKVIKNCLIFIVVIAIIALLSGLLLINS